LTPTWCTPRSWRGTPNRLPDAIPQQADTQLCPGAALVEELADVLTRPTATKRLALIGRTASTALADYVEFIELVAPADVPRIAASVTAQTDLIVSGNHKHLLPLGTHPQARNGRLSGSSTRNLRASSIGRPQRLRHYQGDHGPKRLSRNESRHVYRTDPGKCAGQ